MKPKRTESTLLEAIDEVEENSQSLMSSVHEAKKLNDESKKNLGDAFNMLDKIAQLSQNGRRGHQRNASVANPGVK